MGRHKLGGLLDKIAIERTSQIFSQLVASRYALPCETKVLMKPVGSKAKVCRPPETPSVPEMRDIWKTCDQRVERSNGDTKNKNI